MARDTIHSGVRKALEKENWQIIADPYRISYGEKFLEADMRADKLIAATRRNRTIVIEVKSFLRLSFINEFTSACGQYNAYVILLRELGIEDTVYMAVSHEIYEREFHGKLVKLLTEGIGLNLVVVDIEKEAIVQWID